jgi:uncharacterized protein
MISAVTADPLSAAHAKERELIRWLQAQPSVLVAFSGGVDSAYLACAALDAMGAERMLAVIGRSPTFPSEQWDTARRVAASRGIPVEEVNTMELDDPRYASNPTNRCFFCKSELWSRLGPIARERGLAVIVDGTNADDLADYRPGSKAAREFGVRSPLADAGLTKSEIRLLSRERNLATWAQPSAPCLASRLPYGTEVTMARVRMVEDAEAALRALGIQGDLRVRYHGDLARIEMDAARIDEWISARGLRKLTAAVVTAGFARVALDVRGFRSGSLNVLAGVAQAKTKVTE